MGPSLYLEKVTLRSKPNIVFACGVGGWPVSNDEQSHERCGNDLRRKTKQIDNTDKFSESSKNQKKCQF